MARISNRQHSSDKNWKPAKNAERERSRVRSLRNAFQTLQSCLPSVPPDTKLSKLDILILATNYISILMNTLDNNNVNQINSTLDIDDNSTKVYRPIKRWPMRSRLYSMIVTGDQCSN